MSNEREALLARLGAPLRIEYGGIERVFNAAGEVVQTGDPGLRPGQIDVVAAINLAHELSSSDPLAEVAAAIGGTEFLDPPDGGDVPVAEQVRRMRACIDRMRGQIVDEKPHLLASEWGRLGKALSAARTEADHAAEIAAAFRAALRSIIPLTGGAIANTGVSDELLARAAPECVERAMQARYPKLTGLNLPWRQDPNGLWLIRDCLGNKVINCALAFEKGGDQSFAERLAAGIVLAVNLLNRPDDEVCATSIEELHQNPEVHTPAMVAIALDGITNRETAERIARVMVEESRPERVAIASQSEIDHSFGDPRAIAPMTADELHAAAYDPNWRTAEDEPDGATVEHFVSTTDKIGDHAVGITIPLTEMEAKRIAIYSQFETSPSFASPGYKPQPMTAADMLAAAHAPLEPPGGWMSESEFADHFGSEDDDVIVEFVSEDEADRIVAEAARQFPIPTETQTIAKTPAGDFIVTDGPAEVVEVRADGAPIEFEVEERPRVQRDVLDLAIDLVAGLGPAEIDQGAVTRTRAAMNETVEAPKVEHMIAVTFDSEAERQSYRESPAQTEARRREQEQAEVILAHRRPDPIGLLHMLVGGAEMRTADERNTTTYAVLHALLAQVSRMSHRLKVLEGEGIRGEEAVARKVQDMEAAATASRARTDAIMAGGAPNNG